MEVGRKRVPILVRRQFFILRSSFFIVSDLFHFAPRLHLAQHGGYGQRTVVVLGREDHALADEAVLELARSQVGDEQYLFAHQFFGFVVLAMPLTMVRFSRPSAILN